MLTEELYEINRFQLVIAVALLFFFALLLLVQSAFPIVQCPDINGMPINYPDGTECITEKEWEEMEEEDEKDHEEWAKEND